MKQEIKRFIIATLGTLAIHLLAAILLGIFNSRYMSRLPVNDVEVSVGISTERTSGGGGKRGSVAKVPKQEIVKEKRIDVPAEITEKIKPDEEVKSQKEPAENTFASDDQSVGNKNNRGRGEESGEGNNTEKGGGDGIGSGSGSGGGTGSGVGDGVPVTPPRVLISVTPEYPFSAKNSEIQGTAYVRMSIDTGGTVVGVELVQSSGHSILDSSAVKAAYGWSFSPALDRNGNPSACTITMPMVFSLHN